MMNRIERYHVLATQHALVGKQVLWTSQANGVVKTKHGEVIAVVPVAAEHLWLFGHWEQAHALVGTRISASQCRWDGWLPPGRPIVKVRRVGVKGAELKPWYYAPVSNLEIKDG